MVIRPWIVRTLSEEILSKLLNDSNENKDEVVPDILTILIAAVLSAGIIKIMCQYRLLSKLIIWQNNAHYIIVPIHM